MRCAQSWLSVNRLMVTTSARNLSRGGIRFIRRAARRSRAIRGCGWSSSSSSTEMVTIRRATASDAARLADLRYEFRTSLRSPAEARAAFVERCTEWMQQRLADSSWLCWVADDGAALVGHVWLDIMEKIPNPGPEDELHGYITNLYVQDSMRNQGIGAQLL